MANLTEIPPFLINWELSDKRLRAEWAGSLISHRQLVKSNDEESRVLIDCHEFVLRARIEDTSQAVRKNYFYCFDCRGWALVPSLEETGYSTGESVFCPVCELPLRLVDGQQNV